MEIKTSTKWIIGGVVSAIFTIAGILYIKNQINLMFDFCYKIANFKINSLRKENVSISFFLKLTNQSKQVIVLTGYSFDLLINNFKIAVIKSDKNQIWKAEATSIITFDVNTDLTKLNMPLLDMLNLVNDFIADKNKIIITIDGKLSARLFNVIPINNYPIRISYTLKELLANNEMPTTCKVK